MDTKTFGRTHGRVGGTADSRDGLGAGSQAPDDAWTVDDVVRSIRTGDEARGRARRWTVALGAAVIALVTTAAALSGGHPATAAKPAALPSRVATAAAAAPGTSRGIAIPAPAGLPSRIAAAAGHRPAARASSVIVLMPADHDALFTASVPVAGMALGRPHGPRVRSVHVAVFVDGRLVGGTDLEVYAGRFAGVVNLAKPIDHADAELRFTNPANPAHAAVIRSITLDARSTAR